MGNPHAKGKKGHKGGTGRPPLEDRSKVKSVQFAGQRWEPANVARWKAFMTDLGMTEKEFEEGAFDAYIAQ